MDKTKRRFCGFSNNSSRGYRTENSFEGNVAESRNNVHSGPAGQGHKDPNYAELDAYIHDVIDHTSFHDTFVFEKTGEPYGQENPQLR